MRGHHPAHRQPWWIVDGIRRDLARADDHEVTDDRPLVVSMSDLAASGGYYLAMAATYIVAQPGHADRVDWRGHGQDRDWWASTRSSARTSRPSARASTPRCPRRIARSPTSNGRRSRTRSRRPTISSWKAAESRHTSPQKIDPIAQGRVWTGRQAGRRTRRRTGWPDRAMTRQRCVRTSPPTMTCSSSSIRRPYLPRSVLASRLQVRWRASRTTAEALISLMGARDPQLVAALRAFPSVPCRRAAGAHALRLRSLGASWLSGVGGRPITTDERETPGVDSTTPALVCARACALTAAAARRRR